MRRTTTVRTTIALSLAPLALAALLGSTVGCSSSPADVSGVYSVGITNGDNGCAFPNWTVGSMASAVPFTVTQSQGEVVGTVMGTAGAFVTLVLGSNAFSGTVDGDSVNMTLPGTRAGSMGQCAYTVDATITGTLSGDALSGKIDYTTKTNGVPDCGTLQGCHSIQLFSGSRPPK